MIREMIVHAMRWPIRRPVSDPTADAFFVALAAVARDALEHEPPLALPNSTVPVIEAVMAHTREHLADATVAGVCAAVGVSERTLRRQFPAATGMSWQQYRTQAQVLRSMAVLTEADRTVLSAATAVGFNSLSAFNRAFRRLMGETPSVYRKRVAASRSRTAGVR